MSLIFDKFPNRAQAEAFGAYVTLRFARVVRVFDTQTEADEHDPFPFYLVPPIVHVERTHDGFQLEDEIERSVAQFGGSFAGT